MTASLTAENVVLPQTGAWLPEGKSIPYPSVSPTTIFQVYHAENGIKFQPGENVPTLLVEGSITLSNYRFSLPNFITLEITPPNLVPTPTQSSGGSTVTGASDSAITSAPTGPSQSSPTGPSQSAPTGPSQSAALPSTRPPTSSASSKSSSNGLSGGAVAGVAIGCLIAGAAIAGLLVWFCLRKRRNAQHVRDSEVSTLALMPREKGPVAKAVSIEGGSPVTASLDHALPQPLEDAAISGEISKISNLIKNHVQSFYHTGRGSPGLLDFDDIQSLGHDLPLSTGTLSTLLTNSATREMALRFCIAWVVISRMQPLKELNNNLLPPEVSQCFQAMSFVDRGSKVHALLMARWRAITAELMQSAYVRNPFAPSDSRNANIQAATNILNNVLQPFADSRMDNQQRKQNLEEILKRSALFAFTLFSQPSSWDFDWQDKSEVKSGNLCIFPALVQVTDETGELVRPPRAFNEVVVRRLDE